MKSSIVHNHNLEQLNCNCTNYWNEKQNKKTCKLCEAQHSPS